MSIRCVDVEGVNEIRSAHARRFGRVGQGRLQQCWGRPVASSVGRKSFHCNAHGSGPRHSSSIEFHVVADTGANGEYLRNQGLRGRLQWKCNTFSVLCLPIVIASARGSSFWICSARMVRTSVQSLFPAVRIRRVPVHHMRRSEAMVLGSVNATRFGSPCGYPCGDRFQA